MDYSIRKRIDSMFARDRWMAWIALCLLWITIGYVYTSVDDFVTDASVRIAITVGAFLVLIFNSASILAMIRHYKEDKEHIYGLDIHHLDEGRARKAKEESLIGTTEARL